MLTRLYITTVLAWPAYTTHLSNHPGCSAGLYTHIPVLPEVTGCCALLQPLNCCCTQQCRSAAGQLGRSTHPLPAASPPALALEPARNEAPLSSPSAAFDMQLDGQEQQDSNKTVCYSCAAWAQHKLTSRHLGAPGASSNTIICSPPNILSVAGAPEC
jgi:hypothetical protein